MLGKVIAIATLIAFVFLSAILQTTSPSTSHPVVILVVFSLMYVLALGVLTFLILAINRVIHYFAPEHHKRSVYLSSENSYYYASALALAPVLFFGMQSVGYAGVYELILVILFEVIACFYIYRRRI